MSENQWKEVVLKRSDNRDLRIKAARLVGSGESGSGGPSGFPGDWYRGINVKIYLRKAGGYAWSREYWSCWQGEENTYEAGLAATAEDLLADLMTDAFSAGPAEKGAWDEAVAADVGLTDEIVD